MAVEHVAFGPDDSWVVMRDDDGITWSAGLPDYAYNLLNGRYNKGQNNSPLRYFDMDDDCSYFAAYKNNDWNHRILHGPKDLSNIRCATLGPSGSYVIISDEGRAWRNVPRRMDELLNSRSQAGVKWAALGKDDAWFLSFRDGFYYYGGDVQESLESVLDDTKKCIKKVFLSASCDDWCVIFEDGSIEWAATAPVSFHNEMRKDKWMDPNKIAYLQSSIKSEFSCGRSIQQTADGLRNGRINVDDIPCIKVVEYEGKTYSMNNRRLWAFKKSGIDSIPVEIGFAGDGFKRMLHDRLYNDIYVRDNDGGYSSDFSLY